MWLGSNRILNEKGGYIMNYPKEFKDRVYESFSTSTKMCKLLEEGNIFLGRYLDDCSITYTPTDVLEMLESFGLQKMVKILKEKEKRTVLYSEWCELYEEQK